MNRIVTILAILIAATLITGCSRNGRPAGSEYDDRGFQMLSVSGTSFVDEDGNQVDLRGTNLGNWYLLEMWMLAISDQFPDDYQFRKNLRDRFGDDAERELMDIYRENYIKPRDMEIIKSFGMNVVRLPFNYDILVDEEDGKFDLRPEGLYWLDHAVDMAEEAGLYVIIDMHGVPGRQSIDQPSGRVGQNKLWTDRNAQENLAWLWKQIAANFEGRKCVAAYDIINEPFGDFSMDVREPLRKIAIEVYESIRTVDPDHVIFFPGPIWGGIEFYGSPAEEGWHNVAFTEHHYPGLFGSERSLRSHWGMFTSALPEKQETMERLGAPLFIGEFNPVFEDLGGGDLMRQYFDAYNDLGWPATMWSYKILHREGGSIKDNWYMVSNAEPLPEIDFKSAPKETIAEYFRWFGTMEYVVDEPMRIALTRPDPVRIPVYQSGGGYEAPPATEKLPGWIAEDIGDPKPGGQKLYSPTVMEIYSAGTDIWEQSDNFRYTYRKVRGDASLVIRLHRLLETAQYAKAGLMIRASNAPDAPLVMVHSFPDQRIMFSERTAAGESVTEENPGSAALPVWLKISRQGGRISTSYSQDGDAWTLAGISEVPMGEEYLIGISLTSNNASRFTAAGISDIQFEGNIIEPANIPRARDIANIDPEELFKTNNEDLEIANPSFESSEGWSLEGEAFSIVSDSSARNGEHILRFDPNAGRRPLARVRPEGLPVGGEATVRVHCRIAPDGAASPTPAVLRAEIFDNTGRALVIAEREVEIDPEKTDWQEINLSVHIPEADMQFTLTAGSAWDREGMRDSALDFDDISIAVQAVD